MSERIVAVHAGTGVLTRDLVWCECGRGLSLTGTWIYCPRCGGKIDQSALWFIMSAPTIEECRAEAAIPLLTSYACEVNPCRETVACEDDLKACESCGRHGCERCISGFYCRACEARSRNAMQVTLGEIEALMARMISGLIGADLAAQSMVDIGNRLSLWDGGRTV